MWKICVCGRGVHAHVCIVCMMYLGGGVYCMCVSGMFVYCMCECECGLFNTTFIKYSCNFIFSFFSPVHWFGRCCSFCLKTVWLEVEQADAVYHTLTDNEWWPVHALNVAYPHPCIPGFQVTMPLAKCTTSLMRKRRWWLREEACVPSICLS